MQTDSDGDIANNYSVFAKKCRDLMDEIEAGKFTWTTRNTYKRKIKELMIRARELHYATPYARRQLMLIRAEFEK